MTLTYRTLLCATTLLIMGGCQQMGFVGVTKAPQSKTEITNCLRTIMALDEGRWSYMGTIAQVRGTFRTFETTSVHAVAGPDMWSNKAFGGDVGGTEDEAEEGFVKLLGTSMVPIEDGELDLDTALNYKSCTGPDEEGRYEATSEYKIPIGEGAFATSKNTTWYSKHGSYYFEDIYNAEGRLASRRSGVNTPAE